MYPCHVRKKCYKYNIHVNKNIHYLLSLMGTWERGIFSMLAPFYSMFLWVSFQLWAHFFSSVHSGGATFYRPSVSTFHYVFNIYFIYLFCSFIFKAVLVLYLRADVIIPVSKWEITESEAVYLDPHLAKNYSKTWTYVLCCATILVVNWFQTWQTSSSFIVEWKWKDANSLWLDRPNYIIFQCYLLCKFNRLHFSTMHCSNNLTLLVWGQY